MLLHPTCMLHIMFAMAKNWILRFVGKTEVIQIKEGKKKKKIFAVLLNGLLTVNSRLAAESFASWRKYFI